MGCVSSVFQFGSYLVQEGAEVNEEQREAEKDGIQVPSSPSQDTMVTAASSGGDNIQASSTKTEAPLAREEESFTQQASPVAAETKEEPKQIDGGKAEDNQATEPEVKELQRVSETKLEKEKTVDTSGVTTEKTVYTQMAESVTIQETKGPVVDPFTSQKTVFPPFSKSWHEFKPQATESQVSPSYVHSVSVTESNYSSPSSPKSVSSEAVTPEKTLLVEEFSENTSANIASVPEDAEISAKTDEVLSDEAKGLTESQTYQPESEAQEEPAHVEQETPNIKADTVYEEQVSDDHERSYDVEGAVVKIQAGIRGYLTRKALKESRKDGPLLQSPNGGASVQSPSKQSEFSSEEPQVFSAEEIQESDDAAVTEINESDAAIKIQAVYRGYKTRKQLGEVLDEPCDEEVETLNLSAQETENTVQENQRSSPDRSPVTVTENFVPLLKAEVTITPPSSPTIKKERNIDVASSMEAAGEDSKVSEIPMSSGSMDETPDAVMPKESEDESKEQAATKIQAAFRGYKVRKTSRKEPVGKVKEISEDVEENIDLEFGFNENVDRNESPYVVRDTTPSPPLDPDEEDTLEDDAEDDADEIPTVQWQTSELYTVEVPSPKHLHEDVESKTDSRADEAATASVSDSPKVTHISSQQVTISTSKTSPDKSSHGSAKPTDVKEQ